MKITYLHQYFATPAGSGGTRSYEIAKRMVAAGHDVTIVTSSSFLDASEFDADDRSGSTVIDGIRCKIINVPYGNEMSFRRRILSFADFAIRSSSIAARTDADVIFATSTPLTIAIPGIVARLAQRAPMVFEVRDLWPELPIAMGALRNPISRRAARLLEWVAYRSSSHIIALSPGMADGVTARGVDTDNVTVIPNACDTATFAAPQENAEQFLSDLLGFRPEGPVVCYAGTFGLINGVGYLVDLAALSKEMAPELTFLIVGSGAERAEIEAKARRLGVLDDNLHIRAPITKNEMPTLLAACTVATSMFIDLPEMRNNSANKFFDALAAGTPLAINYGGWHRELLESSGAGIALHPTDLQEAAEVLVEFVRSDHRTKEAALAATELAKRFDRSKLTADLIEVIERVNDTA